MITSLYLLSISGKSASNSMQFAVQESPFYSNKPGHIHRLLSSRQNTSHVCLHDDGQSKKL
jgi:hypothetical protein